MVLGDREVWRRRLWPRCAWYYSLVSWSEHRLHAWLAKRPKPRSLRGSVGHDAAVLGTCSRRRAVCVDQTIEGVHFTADASPRSIATKAVGRALSDLAATAARPEQVLLSLSAPKGKSEAWLRALITAASDRAAQFGAELVAGDLACAPGGVHISVTALGSLPGKGRAPGRDRARKGQLVLLSGPTGGSIRGRHLNIAPRLDEGQWLHANGATAMMDVSDGLALDLTRLATQSGVGIVLETVLVHRDAKWLARKDGRPARQHALTDGEDHELIATIDRKSWTAVEARARAKFPALLVIGRVVASGGLQVVSERGEVEPWKGSGGWLHG